VELAPKADVGFGALALGGAGVRVALLKLNPNIDTSRLYRFARLRSNCSSLPSYFLSNLSISDTLLGLYF